jgi:transcriptional antiterminator RfaH
MNFWSETNWFAVQTKPHREEVAAANIRKLDLEVFFPLVRREETVAGVKRVITKPLFGGYLFARFAPVVSIDAVRYATAVLRVLGTRQSPLPVAAEIIASIQDRVEPEGFIFLERRRLQAGEQVSIESGPFAGWMGCVQREWDDGRRVSILLEAIQQARLVIARDWLQTEQP